jgi:hypothetical protein
MAHRLLVAPIRRLEGQIRLPMIQDISGANTRQWYASLRTRESLRLARTSQTQIAPGPLPGIQRFTLAGPGYPNTPESMANGLRKANSPALAATTRGQSATAANNAAPGGA